MFREEVMLMNIFEREGWYENKIVELEKQLSLLLAVIHRDGGHYMHENGIEKSIEDGVLKTLTAYHAIDELKRYFTSGNSIPVERSTILAKDFWTIIGEEPICC